MILLPFALQAQTDSLAIDDYFVVQDSIEVVRQDSTLPAAWHHSPIYRQVNTLKVVSENGDARGLLLVATEDLLVLWVNPDQPLSPNNYEGNIRIFHPNQIKRLRSYFEGYYIYISTGVIIGSALSFTVGSVSEEGAPEAAMLCCVPTGGTCGGLIGGLIAFLKSRPHVSKYVDRDVSKYLQALPKLHKLSIYKFGVPTQLNDYLEKRGVKAPVLSE